MIKVERYLLPTRELSAQFQMPTMQYSAQRFDLLPSSSTCVLTDEYLCNTEAPTIPRALGRISTAMNVAQYTPNVLLNARTKDETL